jgi:DNA invertase Pin-like site-specific DNA recombinase
MLYGFNVREYYSRPGKGKAIKINSNAEKNQLTMETKVCLFGRVSTLMQDNNRQLNELKQYCKENNYKVVKTIFSTVSGRAPFIKREDLQQLVKMAAGGSFQKIIVTELSRLGRIAKDVRRLIDTIHGHKVAFIFKSQGNIESLNPDGTENFVSSIIISVYNELSQEEVRRLSQSVKSGIETARKKGKQIGRSAGTKETEKQFLLKHRSLARDIKKGYSLSQLVKLHQVAKNTVIKARKIIHEGN